MKIFNAEFYLISQHTQVFFKMEQYRTLHEDLSAFLLASLNTTAAKTISNISFRNK